MQTQSQANLIKSLVKFQLEVPSIQKNKVNPFFSKGNNVAMYADLSEVVRTCMPCLNSNGLAVTQVMMVFGEIKANVLVTKLLHVSGETMESAIFLPEISDPQKLTAAITYLRRTQYVSILGLVADDDDDGNAVGSHPQTPAHHNQQPTKSVQTPGPAKHNPSQVTSMENRPATEKQIEFLKRMGAKIQPGLTLKQAGEMIQSLQMKQN